MRTPKALYANQRIIYHPALRRCPSCGDLLVGCHYLTWDKRVQSLDHVLSIASRPAHCTNSVRNTSPLTTCASLMPRRDIPWPPWVTATLEPKAPNTRANCHP